MDPRGQAWRLLIPNRSTLLGAVLACGGVGMLACGAAEAGHEIRLQSIEGLRRSTNRVGFSRLGPAETGIRFTNRVSLAAVARNRLIEDGSGVAAGDIDGDGRCDLYFCSLEGDNRLYRNLGGLRFVDITEASGVRCAGQASTGTALVDLDGDGDLDLLVNGLGAGTRLFLNEGRGRFIEKTDSGLRPGSGARSLAIADVDGDGDLDVYVANYRPTTSRDEPQTIRMSRRGNGFAVPAPLRERFTAEANDRGGAVLLELGEPDELYLNSGAGRFEAVSWTGGAFLDESGRPLDGPPRDWGLSAMFHDLNLDGAPDLYVCNDFHTPDRLWLNDGKGRFRAAPATAMRKQSWASMAVDFADLDGDGMDEFFVAEMSGSTRARRHVQRDNVEGPGIPSVGWGWPPGEITQAAAVMRNTLFLNQGGGHFAEAALSAGVAASDWTWGAVFLDVNLDGYPDLLIANGHVRDHLNSDIQTRLAFAGAPRNAADRAALFGQIPALAVPKRAFRNRGDLTFEEVGAAWGFDWVGVSTGMAMADLDGDGDLEVVVNNMDDGPFVLRNETTAPRILVRALGAAPNTAGIGARIRVRAPGLPAQGQEVRSGGRYLSSDDAVRAFAAGDATRFSTVEVTWRSGRQTVLTNVGPDQIVTVREPAGPGGPAVTPTPGAGGSWYASFSRPPPAPAAGVGGGSRPGAAGPLFQDSSPRLQLTHRRVPYDDLARQPLLPWRLSHASPGLSCFDINGDGHEDVILTGGGTTPMAVRIGDGSGQFAAPSSGVLPVLPPGEQTTAVGWSTGPATGLMVVGISGYELATNPPISVAVYSWAGTNVQSTGRLAVGSHVGPIAAADIDADGDLDVFVGGLSEPGRYPVAAPSTLLRHTGGGLVPDAELTGQLGSVGLVNGAVWSDLDGDGMPELILACEWGPVRVFRFGTGRWVEWNPAVSSEPGRFLSQLTGWWNGVTTGDFNGDGRLDIVALNWGRNTVHEEHLAGGLRIYHGDLEERGTWDIIEAHRDAGIGFEVPGRDYRTMSRAFPSILPRIRRYAAYATNSLRFIFGQDLDRASLLEVVTLDSMVLLNLGDHFEARPLPFAAQLAPGLSPVVADFDGDGAEDLFLGQNSFATDREGGRLDSGRGLLLRGDGRGGFAALPSDESGIELTGEQRGCATADFDEDGRPDIVVAQHAAPARLLLNRGAKPGLRVRLVGLPGNRGGIGAQLRLTTVGGSGPVREIHAGSGYRSQDSAVVVLARPSEPGRLRVRWPGGRVTETDVPSNVREITVDQDTNIKN